MFASFQCSHGFNIAVLFAWFEVLHGFDNSFSRCRFAVFALFAGFSCIVLSVYSRDPHIILIFQPIILFSNSFFDFPSLFSLFSMTWVRTQH